MKRQRRWFTLAAATLCCGLCLFLPTFVDAQSAPGLKARIDGVKINADRRLVVTFAINDGQGKPLNLKDMGPANVKFTVAVIQTSKSGETNYRNYILTKATGKDYFLNGENKKLSVAETLQPDFDQGGALQRVRLGVFTYTFKTPLPADYDRNATHVVGAELARDHGKYFAHPIFEFVPSGAKVKLRRSVVETASCNNCHDPLKAHGGASREVGTCALCHTPQLMDPESGESLDFKVFVHKIHRGKLLPSVKEGKPYFVVGAGQLVKEYSSIRYPQAMLADGGYRELRNCHACHASPEKDHWKKFPSAASCTSCHDNVDLTSGKNHKLGPAAEGTCIACHQPDGTEFGPSIAGAHTFPGFSAHLPGVVFEILKIDGGKPGASPTVTFSVKNKKGEPLDAAKMPNLRLVLAWPTSDYKVAVEEDVRKAQSAGNGVYIYKFRYTIPADATGSGAIGIQGFLQADLNKPNGSIIKGQRDVGFNVVKYFAITDAESIPRRQVVKVENCNVCHLTLATHGETRRNTEFCVMCHNATQTDGDKRKTAKGPEPAENIHFKRLIHRIHTGAKMGESWILYGGVPAKPGAIEFGDIRFPGDRRNCVKCHLPGTIEPPLPEGLLATMIPQKDGSVRALQPITSACVGCHAQEPAKLHMDTMTASNGRESCVTCHGVGRTFAVEKVHQR